jgi:hypothetical protein
MISVGIEPDARIEGMLKCGAEEHTGMVATNILYAIPMVYIKINNRELFQSIPIHCIARTHSNIIEQTKSHGTVDLGMVTTRTYATKCRFCLIGNDKANSLDHGTCGAQCRSGLKRHLPHL